MKIDKISGIEQNITAPGKPAGAASGLSFADLLNRELSAASASTEVAGLSGVSRASEVSAGLKVESLGLIENTIATLEKFSASLADSAFSPQDLAPYAAALADESAALMDLKKQLPADNPLAAILERVATVSYVEAAKLERGDYRV